MEWKFTPGNVHQSAFATTLTEFMCMEFSLHYFNQHILHLHPGLTYAMRACMVCMLLAHSIEGVFSMAEHLIEIVIFIKPLCDCIIGRCKRSWSNLECRTSDAFEHTRTHSHSWALNERWFAIYLVCVCIRWLCLTIKCTTTIVCTRNLDFFKQILIGMT